MLARGLHAIDLAAFELECPRNQLEVIDLGNWTIGVKGCGKKATLGNTDD